MCSVAIGVATSALRTVRSLNLLPSLAFRPALQTVVTGAAISITVSIYGCSQQDIFLLPKATIMFITLPPLT